MEKSIMTFLGTHETFFRSEMNNINWFSILQIDINKSCHAFLCMAKATIHFYHVFWIDALCTYLYITFWRDKGKFRSNDGNLKDLSFILNQIIWKVSNWKCSCTNKIATILFNSISVMCCEWSRARYTARHILFSIFFMVSVNYGFVFNIFRNFVSLNFTDGDL